jgi:hypothetical protein
MRYVAPARSHLTTNETMQASLQPFRAFGNAGSTDNGEQHVLERQINKTDCEVLRAYLSRRRELPSVVEGQPRASSPRLSEIFIASFRHRFTFVLVLTSIFPYHQHPSSLGQNGVTPHHLHGSAENIPAVSNNLQLASTALPLYYPFPIAKPHLVDHVGSCCGSRFASG